MEQNNQLPENIRLNLKKFDQHREVTCLECGYIGLMGIKKSNSTVIFWIVLFGVNFVLAATGIGFLFMFIFSCICMVFKSLVLGQNVVCPNCENNLKVR